MLLRSALGMAIVMLLMGMAQNIWQFLILRALLGLLGGFIPNANALIATQVPRHKSGWALGTLSTGGVSGALLGPLAGGLLADHYGLRPVFLLPPAFCLSVFCSPSFYSREFPAGEQKRDASRSGSGRLVKKSPPGVKPVCHHADYSGGDGVYCAHPDALCARTRGKCQ